MLFKKKTEKVQVSTAKELKEAIDRKEQNIEVIGNLAQKLRWMAKMSPKKAIEIVGALLAIGFAGPLTGGASVAAAMPAMTKIVGKDLALVILSCSVSASLIVALFKGYDIKLGAGDNIVCFTLKNK